jgi:putative RecB family exonuclease
VTRQPTDHGQLGFPGMPRRLFSCTPSRLASWSDCPRRYRMTYLDRPRPAAGAPWAHNSLGAAVHNALAAWWRLPVLQRTVARAGALLESGWKHDGFRDDAQSLGWRERAKTLVEDYVEQLDPTDEPLGVERTVAARTERLALSGRLDRLDDRDGELVVVDYKTGRRPLTTDDARGSMALALYAVAVARTLRRPCHRVELHHIQSGAVVGWEHTDESLARQLDRAEDIASDAAAAHREFADAGVDSQAFAPVPGSQCGWCDLRAHCPEGQQAGPARRPWDGLADLESDQPVA